MRKLLFLGIILSAFIVGAAVLSSAADPDKPSVTVYLTNGKTVDFRFDWIDENKVIGIGPVEGKLDKIQYSRDKVLAISFDGKDHSDKFRVGESGVVLTNAAVNKGKITGVDETNFFITRANGTKDQIARSEVAYIQLAKPAEEKVTPVAGSGKRFVVPATAQWTDTGIDVKEGDRLWFQASAEDLVICGDRVNRANPDGVDPFVQDSRRPLPDVKACALVGQVGSTGTPFFIGLKDTMFVMKENGRLRLGINDHDFRDNTGQFTVIVKENP